MTRVAPGRGDRARPGPRDGAWPGPRGRAAAGPSPDDRATAAPDDRAIAAPDERPIRARRASLAPTRRLAAVPGRLLVVADFDGTLADLDPDPMGAVMVPSARRALRRLARVAWLRPDRLAVAILTGRTAVDVARRVRVGGIHYLGNMGNESGLLARREAAERLRVVPVEGLEGHVGLAERMGAAVAGALARSVGGGRPPVWLFVERKGPSTALHYRAAPDLEVARQQLERALAAVEADGLLEGFTRREGRHLIDFQPNEAGAKGEAVARLLDELRPAAAAVLGDDRADAEAFRALGLARREGRLADALSVAVRHPHPLPVEVEATADLVVDGTRAAARLLAALATALEREA